jgi:hypothetical protein
LLRKKPSCGDFVEVFGVTWLISFVAFLGMKTVGDKMNTYSRRSRTLVSVKLLFKTLIASAVALLSSCSEPGGTIVDVNFYLLLRNADGKNLLDSATIGYYAKDSIRLYRLENGVKTELYRPNLDASRNFVIVQNSNDEYGMMVFADEGTGEQSQTTTTLIQWQLKDSHNVDTVQTYIDKKYTDSNVAVILKKITYNGTVVWDGATSPSSVQWGSGEYSRMVEVIK